METSIQELTAQLKVDMIYHEQVGAKLSDTEIQEFEEQHHVKLPPSYRTLLTEFGDGAYWLYGCQPLDSIKRPVWLKDLRLQMPDVVIVDDTRSVVREALLCLMTEDSNGGSWCWLTTEPDSNGEWPLAYYEQYQAKLFYQVATFADWLKMLITNRAEVIRSLDTDDSLGLG